ncbi:MAG: hypothetical protein WAQ27_04425 [Candidatus Microsaccharimonas sp.]
MKINTLKHNKKGPNKIWIIVSIILFLCIATYVVYGTTTKSVWPFNTNKVTANNPSDEIRGINDVDYSPPSEEDAEQSKAGKDKLTDDSGNSNTTTDGQKSVAVGVSFADLIDNKVEIRAFTPGIVEGSGTCLATLTKNNLSVTASSKAFIDSTSSQCTPIYIDVSKFQEKGVWDLTVTYTSPQAAGRSDVIEVKI